MPRRKVIDKEKWIRDTARLFYQIFSIEYDDDFKKKLLSGGGGNSTLCATWSQLVNYFVRNRISENAYNLLLTKVNSSDRNKIRLENDTVYISAKIFKKYHGMFYNDAKYAQNRIAVGKYFHFDHHPSNKKVLELLCEEISTHKNEEGFIDNLTEYVRTVQSLDLITVQEDDIRTMADKRSANGPLSLEEREDLLKGKFYPLIIE